jgi:hypothetical protein
MLMPVESGMKRATEAAAKKREQEGVLYIPCAACQKQMRRWRSQVRRARLPMACSKTCRSLVMRGENNPQWRGGTWIDKRSGYRFVLTARLNRADRSLLPIPAPRDVPEHRLIMARTLGRWLTKEEHVHHINGNKTDNRPENLRIMNWTEHSKEHRKVLRMIAELEAENQTLRIALAGK